MEVIKSMEEESIGEKIKGFLVEEFEVDAEKITPNGNMREILALDSLDYIDLGVVIESNFGFKVRHEDFAPITTFQNLYDYVLAQIKKAES